MATSTTENKKTLIGKVEETEKVDMSIWGFLVEIDVTFDTEEVEYDVVDNKSKTATYTKFSETANIIKRNGIDTVRLVPFFINDDVPFSQIELYKRRAGIPANVKTGTAISEVAAEAINDYAHSGALKRRKKLIAGFLMNLKLTKANDLVEADYNIDTVTMYEEKTSGKWNAANAPVVEDLAKIVKRSKASAVVMNRNTYDYMIKNGDLQTGDNSNGKGKNYFINKDADMNKELYKAGTVNDPLVKVDIYVWEPSPFENETYLEDGFVCGLRPKSLIGLFGGIVTTERGDLEIVVEKFWIEKIIQKNPSRKSIIYKSAPMIAPKGTKGFSTMKTY